MSFISECCALILAQVETSALRFMKNNYESEFAPITSDVW